MSFSELFTAPLIISLIALAGAIVGGAGALFAFRQVRLAKEAGDARNIAILDKAWNLLRGKTGSKQVVLRFENQVSIVEARQFVEQVAATRRLSAKYYQVLGLLLECEQRPAEAAKAYEEGIKRFGSPNCHVNLGTIKGRNGQLSEALRHFDAALAIAPSYTFAYCCRGWILGDMGRIDDGIQACSSALAIEPNNALAHNNLAWLLEKKGEYELAEQHARRGLDIDPAQPHIWETLGSVLMKKGRLHEAVPCFYRALDIKVDYVLPMRKLVLCLKRMGQRDEAKAVLERLRKVRVSSARTDQPISRRN